MGIERQMLVSDGAQLVQKCLLRVTGFVKVEYSHPYFLACRPIWMV